MIDFYNGATPLTLLCPIKNGYVGQQSFAAATREYLQNLDDLKVSPLSRVPDTFLCRFYILNDVFFEGLPAKEDNLKSRYLVFCCNFHGTQEDYLTGFWAHAEDAARQIWQHCVGFDQVASAQSFIEYIKKCEVKTTFYFNGSSGRPLREQLKALYLKQEFTQFAVANQKSSPAQLRQAFRRFIAHCQPDNLDGPTWLPGMNSLDEISDHANKSDI